MMLSHLWRVAQGRGYRRGMATRRMQPEKRLDELDRWVGCWVAVKNGKVVAAAHNSRDLVPELRKLGPAAAGAVAQYVTPPSDDIMIGVG
jgi:ribosome modulation factor